MNFKSNIMEQILSPISIEEFIESYFQQQVLHIPGDKQKYKFLFKTDDFKKNLDRVDHIRAIFPLLRQAYIGIADIPDMLRAGASICVTGMEKAHPKLQHATQEIKSILNYTGKISFRAYLSPKNTGLDLHFDSRVASTLQISGSKRWWYKLDSDTRYANKNSPHTEYLSESEFNSPDESDMETVLLEPGDFLCLPAGVWHSAKAEEDSLSLNLAFDHKHASYGDFLLLVLKEQFDRKIENREPMYSIAKLPYKDKKVIDHTLDGIRQMICELEKLANDEELLQEHLRVYFELITKLKT